MPAGANPDARDNKNNTPLDVARGKGHRDVVALLPASISLDHGQTL
jgi:ankyrin repeat protein